jgi:hypothetical protein
MAHLLTSSSMVLTNGASSASEQLLKVALVPLPG